MTVDTYCITTSRGCGLMDADIYCINTRREFGLMIVKPKNTCHDRRQTMALPKYTCPVPPPTQPLSLFTQKQSVMVAAGASSLLPLSQFASLVSPASAGTIGSTGSPGELNSDKLNTGLGLPPYASLAQLVSM